MVRKGQQGVFVGVIMLVIIVIAMFGIITFAAGTVDQANKHMDDLNTLSLAANYGDYIQYQFTRQSADISQDLAKYEVGEEEGEPHFSQVNPSLVEQDMKSSLDTEAKDFLDEYMATAFFEIPCDGQATYDISTDRESGSVTPDQDSDNYITCSGRMAEARYNMTGGSHALRGATRWWELIDLIEEWFEEMEEMEEIEATGSSSGACREESYSSSQIESVEDDAKEDAQSNAMSTYEDEAEDHLSEAMDSDDDFEDIHLDEGVDTSQPSPHWEEAEADSSDSWCCAGSWVPQYDDDGNLIGQECTQDGESYSATAEYTLEAVTASSGLLNENGKIFTDSGTDYPLLRSSYRHNLESSNDE